MKLFNHVQIKVKDLAVLFTIFILISCNSFAETSHTKLQFGKRIGILSVFPGKSGMFYDDRALLIDGKEKISIFPKKSIDFNFNINNDIVNVLVKKLQPQYKEQHQFISLEPFVDIENRLTGYAIEGWWGYETNSVNIKGLKNIFQKYKLDNIIAIVPVTYYLPPIKGEATGMNLSFVKNQMSFSSTYAVIVFSKSSDGSQKSYNSIKQVYFASRNDFDKLSSKKYEQQHIDFYYDLFKYNFLPYLTNQVVNLLSHDLSNSVFPKPKKPFHYYLPH